MTVRDCVKLIAIRYMTMISRKVTYLHAKNEFKRNYLADMLKRSIVVYHLRGTIRTMGVINNALQY